jgi:hypothetical protein
MIDYYLYLSSSIIFRFNFETMSDKYTSGSQRSLGNTRDKGNIQLRLDIVEQSNLWKLRKEFHLMENKKPDELEADERH